MFNIFKKNKTAIVDDCVSISEKVIDTMEFYIVGQRYNNSDGTSREDALFGIERRLRREHKKAERYSGMTDEDILRDGHFHSEVESFPYNGLEFNEYLFEGENAVSIFSSYGQIGHMPKKLVNEYLSKKTNSDKINIVGHLTGCTCKCPKNGKIDAYEADPGMLVHIDFIKIIDCD